MAHPINIYRETSCYLYDTAHNQCSWAKSKGDQEFPSSVRFVPWSLRHGPSFYSHLSTKYSDGVNDASYWPRRMRVENTRWIASVTAERWSVSKARKEERRGGVFFGFTWHHALPRYNRADRSGKLLPSCGMLDRPPGMWASVFTTDSLLPFSSSPFTLACFISAFYGVFHTRDFASLLPSLFLSRLFSLLPRLLATLGDTQPNPSQLNLN